MNDHNNNPSIPAAANMSLGGPVNFSIDNAVNNAISAGVTFAIAAENNGVDAMNTSPARVEAALTIGASDINDSRSFFGGGFASNFWPSPRRLCAGIGNPFRLDRERYSD